MKRILVGIVVLVLALACLPAMAETWYCPQCGRLNDSNFCPVDGTQKPALNGYTGNTSAGYYTQYAYATGVLNSKLATRTGPSTKYDEPGTFLSAGRQVTVLSKAYDSRNEIWWVQVEFSAGGAQYRAYTGVKRFNGLNLQYIPEEYAIGSCTVNGKTAGYYGPSYAYKEIPRKVPSGVKCTVYGYATDGGSDFVQIEFQDSVNNQLRRAWVPTWAVNYLNLY